MRRKIFNLPAKTGHDTPGDARVQPSTKTPVLGSKYMLIALAMGILAGPVAAGDLAGRWQFIAETSEGRLAAQITFIHAEGKTQARMSIDGHILEGDVHGGPGGFTLELHDREAPGDPAHHHRLSLKGKLIGEELAGAWDDGTSQGSWTGRRQ